MTDEPFYSSTAKPALARVATPGELLFEFYLERTHRFYRVELRDHGPVLRRRGAISRSDRSDLVPHVSPGPGPDADAARDGDPVG
jgi:hypothetical protein